MLCSTLAVGTPPPERSAPLESSAFGESGQTIRSRAETEEQTTTATINSNAEPIANAARQASGTNATNAIVTAFVVFKDDEGEDFNMDDWIESLMEMRNGIYVKNAQAFIVSHIGDIDGLAAMRNVRARAIAMSMLREHYPDLPQDIKRLPIRTCAYMDDGLIVSIHLKELETLLKSNSHKNTTNHE